MNLRRRFIPEASQDIAIRLLETGNRRFDDDGYEIAYLDTENIEHHAHILVVWANNVFPVKGEHVHHIDRCKTNNNIENLIVLSHKEHFKAHHEHKEDFKKRSEAKEIEEENNYQVEGNEVRKSIKITVVMDEALKDAIKFLGITETAFIKMAIYDKLRGASK